MDARCPPRPLPRRTTDLALEQHCPRVAGVRERLRQLSDEGRVERVAAVRLRERDAEDVTVPRPSARP
jgi:hypothetical protein